MRTRAVDIAQHYRRVSDMLTYTKHLGSDSNPDPVWRQCCYAISRIADGAYQSTLDPQISLYDRWVKYQTLLAQDPNLPDALRVLADQLETQRNRYNNK